MVDRLLALKRSLDEVQRGAWGGAEPCGSALRDSLQRGLNARQNKPAELIAKWLDGRLRAGGSKGLSEGELEAALEAALVLFRAIQVSGWVGVLWSPGLGAQPAKMVLMQPIFLMQYLQAVAAGASACSS
jgi:hypothetical protein